MWLNGSICYTLRSKAVNQNFWIKPRYKSYLEEHRSLGILEESGNSK